MTDQPANPQRRQLLLATTTILGSTTAVLTALPFIDSMNPSERALAAGAPVDVDLSGQLPGQLRTVEWRGKPVWVLRRDDTMLRNLALQRPALADPDSTRAQQPPACKNATRSLVPEWFVGIGICTHLGCSPNLDVNSASAAPAVFRCPCHGSLFDLAGRVYRNMPAPSNLEVPVYRFLTPDLVRIGTPA